MSRLSEDNYQRGGYNGNVETFGDYNTGETPQPTMKERQTMRTNDTNSENVRLYITIRGAPDSVTEYKKLIIMTSMNIKISLLKRQIEREFSDLFPKEPTFICGKIEDQYGYALSNSSYIYEMLKSGDRITAYPDDVVGAINNPSGDRDGVPELHTSGDVTEILYLLRNVQQSLCRKLADGDIQGFAQPEEVLLNVIPLGFSPSRVIVHNVAVILMKSFSTERLYILEGKENAKILNMLVTVLNFWIGEHIGGDNFLLGHVINLLEILVKSATFCESFKGAFVISNLMNTSNLDFVSSQTKSRLIKIITYLSKGNFSNFYNPDRSARSTGVKKSVDKGLFYDSGLDRSNNESRGNLRTSNKNSLVEAGKASMGKLPVMSMGYKEENPISVYDSAYSKPEQSIKRQPKTFDSDIPKSNIKGSYFDIASQNQSNNRPKPDNKLYKDYLDLLTLGNAREMHIFAIQNLDLIIEKIIHDIMDSKEDYLQLLNLVEIELPAQWERAQLKILDAVNENLTEKRAADGLQRNIVPRLLKALSYQPPAFHTVFIGLLQAHLIKGKYRIDVSTVISIILSPYSRLHEFAINALSIMSDPSLSDNLNYEIQFENHMKLLIELTLSKNKSYEFKNTALKTVAHLSLRENLKAQILYNKGLEVLLYHLRNDTNLEGQRLASKALLNLSTSSREIKLKIITEIGEEIRKLHKNELDSIVQGYLQTLINSSR